MRALPPDAATAEKTRALYAKIAWRILPIFLLAQTAGFLDRVNVGFAQFQIKAAFGMNNAAYGLSAGLFFVGYFLFGVPSNMLLRRWGARIWLACIVAVWGMATITLAFARTATWFYAFRFLTGAAESGYAPGTQYYLSQWLPNSYRGRFNGWFLTSLPLSVVIGGPVSGLILGHLDGFGGAAGWQWLFILEGAASIALAPWLFLGLRNVPREAHWLGEDEKQIVEGGVSETAKGATSHSVSDMLRGPAMVGFALTYFLILCGVYGVTFWIPLLIKNAGISGTTAIGWLTGLPYVAAMVAIPILSRLSDKAGARRSYVAGCVLIASAGLCISAYWSASAGVSLLGMTLTAVGVFSAIPIFFALVSARYFGAAAAVGFGIITSWGNLGGFASPYLVGIITDATGTPTDGLYMIAALVGIAILLIGLLRESPRRLEIGTGA